MQESLSAGTSLVFFNSEMPQKIHACPSINKSAERYPGVLLLGVPHSFHHCSLHYLSPQAGLGMRRKLRSTKGSVQTERGNSKRGAIFSWREIVRT